MSTATKPSTAPFECSSCGAVHHTGGHLPVGWSAKFDQGATWCNDCTAAGIPARTINQRADRRRKCA